MLRWYELVTFVINHYCCISGYLNLGYSTPFLSLGASYMYPSLAAAKAAVISVGEEISTAGLPSGICPLVFVFTGSGNGINSMLICETDLFTVTFQIGYPIYNLHF